MKIRFASINDIDQIIKLLEDCKYDLERKGINQWDDVYPSIDIFLKDIENHSLYMIEEEQKCIAIISFDEEQPLEYQKLNWNSTTGKVLTIHRLTVHPDKQKKGLGRLLMSFAEKYASENGYNSIRLDAYNGNTTALNFYTNLGYKKIGILFFPRRDLPFYCFEKIIS